MGLTEVPGASLFHEAAGAGDPALVLVHGGMCDGRDWDRLVPLLARSHAVVVPDLRCHGRSGGAPADCTIERWATDLLALVAALGLDRPVLVGHSMASRVVAEAAALSPAGVAGVVLLDGSRSHGGRASPPPAAPAPAAGGLAAIIDATIGPHADPQARAAIHRTMGAASPELMAACVDAMRAWDVGRADAAFATLAGIVPVLAIQSTYHDAATPRRSLASAEETTPYLDFLREAVPQVEVAVLTRAGHFTMLERPADVARLVADFAARARQD